MDSAIAVGHNWWSIKNFRQRPLAKRVIGTNDICKRTPCVKLGDVLFDRYGVLIWILMRSMLTQ